MTNHVLGERLAKKDIVAVLDEPANGKGVAVRVAAGESLVGHVEEGQVALLRADGGDFLPLRRGRVDTSRIVGAGMEEEDAAAGSLLEVLDQALKVETNGILVVVTVLLNLEAGILEDGLVVGPRGRGDADLLLAVVPALEELGANTEGTGARDGLGHSDAVEDGRVDAIGELGSSLGELGNTGDASVLLVHLLVDNALLSLTDRGQDVGLSSIITVRTNT